MTSLALPIDPRHNAFGFLEDALDEFNGYVFADGELEVPPAIAFRRLGETAYMVLDELPTGWANRHIRRLAQHMARTARLGLRGNIDSPLQLGALVSGQTRKRREVRAKLLH